MEETSRGHTAHQSQRGVCDVGVIQQLMIAAAAGDRDAQDTLLCRYWPTICQVIRARRSRARFVVAQREETLDLQQRAALRMLRDLPKNVWHGRRAFLTWICELAAEQVINPGHRTDVPKQLQSVDAASPDRTAVCTDGSCRTTDSQLDPTGRTLEMQRRLLHLEPKYAAAVVLHHMGYTDAEIGDVLRCSAEAARKLIRRGRLQLVAGEGPSTCADTVEDNPH